MSLLLHYSIRNSLARKLTSLLTMLGIGLVTFVFCAVLMLSNGLKEALVETGRKDNIVVLRQAANSEIVSIIWRDQADVVKADPGIAKGADGRPLFAGELVVLINQPKRNSTETSNLTVRGVSDQSFELRPQVRITKGRRFHPGSSEIIVGSKVAENFSGCEVGQSLHFAMRDWKIVGLIEADGSGFESEIWGDINQFQDAFQRPIFSSMIFRAADPTAFPAIKNRLESDRRLTVEVMPETEYYRRQSRTFSTFIGILGSVVSIIFSLGAIVGAMITMYAAVANRTREIGTLRALGFGRTSLLSAFLFESLLIALAGGIVGLAFANLLTFGEVSTTNFDTFAEIAFSFAMSPTIALQAVLFALIMGLVGGFLPAVRASRLKIVNSLRAK